MLEMVSIVKLEDAIMEHLEKANLMIVKVRSHKYSWLALQFQQIKWGAFSRWSFGPNPARGSIETIRKTHPTLTATNRVSRWFQFLYISILLKDLPLNSMCSDDACTDFVCRTGFWYVFEVGEWYKWECGTEEKPRECRSSSRVSSPIIFSKPNQVFSPPKRDYSRTSRTHGPIFRNNFCEDYNECDDTKMFHDPNDNPG